MTLATAPHPPAVALFPGRQEIDLQWLPISWYGQTLEPLCRRAGLIHVLPGALPPPLGAIPALGSAHTVACSPALAAGRVELASAVVVGGPCIFDCASFPTLEALYDSAQPMLVARGLGLPAVIYL